MGEQRARSVRGEGVEVRVWGVPSPPVRVFTPETWLEGGQAGGREGEGVLGEGPRDLRMF